MVFYSVEELQQLHNKESKKVIFNPTTAKPTKRCSSTQATNALWYSALLRNTVRLQLFKTHMWRRRFIFQMFFRELFKNVYIKKAPQMWFGWCDDTFLTKGSRTFSLPNLNSWMISCDHTCFLRNKILILSLFPSSILWATQENLPPEHQDVAILTDALHTESAWNLLKLLLL